jgi:hypothetical protein
MNTLPIDDDPFALKLLALQPVQLDHPAVSLCERAQDAVAVPSHLLAMAQPPASEIH